MSKRRGVSPFRAFSESTTPMVSQSGQPIPKRASSAYSRASVRVGIMSMKSARSRCLVVTLRGVGALRSNMVIGASRSTAIRGTAGPTTRLIAHRDDGSYQGPSPITGLREPLCSGRGNDPLLNCENPKNSRDRHDGLSHYGAMLAFVACWLTALGSPSRRNNQASRRAGAAPVSGQRPKGGAGATYRDAMMSGQCAAHGFQL
jgi:hypothetical protein